MNHYTFEELYVGQREEFSVTVTEDMLSAFRAVTGDVNPLHTDDAFAIAHNYPGHVVYGLLTASFLSTLAGVYLPGERCLIQSVEVKFPKPVFAGDELLVAGTVAELHESVHQLVLKVEILRRGGVRVLKGTMRLGVLEE